MGFGLVKLALGPVLIDRPVLLAALVGHVLAVTLVTGLSRGVTPAGERAGGQREDLIRLNWSRSASVESPESNSMVPW